jgi:glyoxylase-like metal-dependent hydrolase (beta-lactamase superfamily II)
MKLTRSSLLLGATLLTSLLTSALLGAGCDGDTGPQGPQGPEGPPGGVDQNLSPSDKLFTAMGGKPVLVGLKTLSVTATGSRGVLDEGYLPEDPALIAATFEQKLTWDLEAKHLLLEYQRTVLFPFARNFTFKELLRADGGWRTGVDNVFGIPEGAISSERWAAARKQQLLLHPEVIVRDLAGGKITAKDTGVGVIGGVLHHKLELADTVAPLTLWIEVGTGQLSKLTTMENEHLLGDVEVAAYYSDWKQVTGGVSLPQRAVLTVGGETLHDEQRSAISINGAIDAAVLAVPGGGQTAVNAEEAKRGERSHQFYEMFAALGIPLAGGQTAVTANEAAPGVWFLTGGSHNSLVVVQQDGIVVVEAPLYDARSKALLDWIAGRFPGKPVTHVVATHFHGDHSAGLRTFVAAGATVVAGDAALGLYRKVFAARHTIEPDALARTPVAPKLRGVEPGDVLTLSDQGEGSNEVRIYTVNTTHAADMVVAVANGVLFVSDIFSPGLQPSVPALRELRDTITNHQIGVDLIAGGHGGTATLAQLDALIDGTTPLRLRRAELP